MTARDAATQTGANQTDPTEQAVPDDDATPDRTESAAPTESTESTESTDRAGEPVSVDDGPPEPAGTSERTGRRRHRHATGDAEPPAARPATRRRRWPLVAAVLVAALFAGAMVALWAVTRPDPIAGLSGSQQSAVDAASQAAVNLQTFRRASFDQDFANALASLTPDYGQQQFAPRKDELKKQLTDGARDATATVQSAGLVSSSATQAVVLVVTNTVQTADDGTSTPFVFSRLQLTLQLIDGKWLVSDLKSVGLS